MKGEDNRRQVRIAEQGRRSEDRRVLSEGKERQKSKGAKRIKGEDKKRTNGRE